MTYKIGDVLTTSAEAWKALAAGFIHRDRNGATSAIRGHGLFAWNHIDKHWLNIDNICAGPWTIVEDPSKPAKPERKQLSFDEALVCERVRVEVPQGVKVSGILARPLERSGGWYMGEISLFDLAERRGWPIYEVEEQQ